MDFIKRSPLWAPALVLILCITLLPSVSKAETSKEVMERLAFSGLVEIEASRDENEKDGDTSDIVLATVELGIEAEINERLSAHILFLWEEDDTQPIHMDEGTLTYKAPANLTLTVGKMYIPFGVFNSHFVSDPQVLELGETNETTAMINYVEGPLDVSLGVFNGSMDDTGDDQIQDYYGNVTINLMDSFSLGVYYTSNIGDSDGMTDLLASPVSETVPAYGGALSVGLGPYTLDAEYIRVKREFRVGDLDANGDGVGDKPAAYNVELGWQLSDAMELAARYEGNDDLFDHPEQQYGAVLTYGLFEHVTAKVEYLQGKYADDTKRMLVTGQVGVEF